MNRIALVEDHERLSTLVRKALAAAGIEVDVFDRIASAGHAIAETPYGAIVVDRGLPDGDGLSLVRKLRADGNDTPCLMLTARDAVHDRVEGLEAGLVLLAVVPEAGDDGAFGSLDNVVFKSHFSHQFADVIDLLAGRPLIHHNDHGSCSEKEPSPR